jgi:hypothetical protein
VSGDAEHAVDGPQDGVVVDQRLTRDRVDDHAALVDHQVAGSEDTFSGTLHAVEPLELHLPDFFGGLASEVA